MPHAIHARTAELTDYQRLLAKVGVLSSGRKDPNCCPITHGHQRTRRSSSMTPVSSTALLIEHCPATGGAAPPVQDAPQV
jgi:hypothetical protein